MSDPISNSPAVPVVATEVSFTEHPIDYITAKAEAVLDYFTTEAAPAAPKVAARPVNTQYAKSDYYCYDTFGGGTKCE